jgi:hypothetical protein
MEEIEEKIILQNETTTGEIRDLMERWFLRGMMHSKKIEITLKWRELEEEK